MDEEAAVQMEISSQGSKSRDLNFKMEKQDFDDEDENQQVDLNRCTFYRLVECARNQGLIQQELAQCHFTNYSLIVQKEYIKCYRTKTLHLFDFAKCKINYIDHRRLLQMLRNHNSNKYLPLKTNEPYDYLREGKDFLKQIYQMSSEEYYKILKEQVHNYYQYWWGGPTNPNPRALQSQNNILDVQMEAKRIQKERQLIMKAQKEQQIERMKRIAEQKATTTDLIDIAKFMSSKIFGAREKQPEKQLKIQDSQPSEVGGQGQSDSSGRGKSKKQKKDKKKKDKKDKKEKKEKKKSKGKKDDEVKQQQMEIQPKKEHEEDQNIQKMQGRKMVKQN